MENNYSLKPWTVGVLFSETGVTSIIEKTQLKGTLLAIDEINQAGGIEGREIFPVIMDPGSEVPQYRILAEKMLSNPELNVIFGCYMSSSRKEVVPVIERHNAFLFYPTLYEGFEYSPNVIYGGAAPNQNSLPLAIYLLENFGSRFYFLGSDYIYPRESNRVMRHILRQGGGEVVAEEYLSLNAQCEDFDKILEDIKNTSPDVIFSALVGSGTINFYTA